MGLVVRRPVHDHCLRSAVARQGGTAACRADPAANRLGRRLPLGGGTVVSDQLQIVLIAAGCTSAVALPGMVAIRLLRRASLRLSIQLSGLVPVLAIVAGTLGTAKQMFLSQHD